MKRIFIALLTIPFSYQLIAQQQLALADYASRENENRYRCEMTHGNQTYEAFFSDGFSEYDSIVIVDIMPIDTERAGIKYFAYNRQNGQRLLINTASVLRPASEPDATIQQESELRGKYVQVGAFSSIAHARTYIEQKQLQNTQIVQKENLWKIVIPFSQSNYDAVREKVPDAFVTRFE